MNVEVLFLRFSAEKLRQFTTRIEACLARLTNDQIWARGGENENAVGNLVIHLSGNVREWIVSSLGGQPFSRDRDAEFAARGGLDAAALSALLRESVELAAEVVLQLNTEQLTRTWEIQRRAVTGLEAVYHVVEHFAQHTGQIIFATKMLTGEDLAFYSRLRAAKASGEAR